ncbi:E3 ubiquitin-protein ligase TRIM39-like [Polymixia lowei]
MASANTLLHEDQFLCSICLDVFTDPVSTPCGHNFCKSCITGYWTSSGQTQCPMCKEKFHRGPELRVNTALREVVELFKKTRVREEDSPVKPGEVPCDVCPGTKRKALKSCLVCLASYCQTHLEPHQRAPALKRHKLINPVGNLEDRVCKKHDKTIEFFCRSNQMWVCVVCLKDHMSHETVSLEEEFGERKTQLRKMNNQINQKLHTNCVKVQEITSSIMHSRKVAEKVMADSVEIFSSLVASIKAIQAELIEVMEERQRAAEEKAIGFIKELKLEMAELERRNKEMEQLLQTEDLLHLLLQSPASLSTSPPTRDWSRISFHSPLCVKTVRRATAELKQTLSKEMERVVREVKLSGGEADRDKETAEKQMKTPSEETESLFKDELMRIQQHHAVDVTLDPDTAHACLILSVDRKQVRDGGEKRNLPDNPKRFDSCHFVLGKEGFSKSFYYEVQVKGQSGWEVGVVRESINRKGFDVSLSPAKGCWTVGLYWGRYQANSDPPVILPLRQKPQKVGVFVDYEGQKVSFYNVETRALIHSFTGCMFTGSAPSLEGILWYFTGSTLSTRLHPLLRPNIDVESSSAPLTITPV